MKIKPSIFRRAQPCRHPFNPLGMTRPWLNDGRGTVTAEGGSTSRRSARRCYSFNLSAPAFVGSTHASVRPQQLDIP